MPFDLSTKTSVAARQTIAHCERLPAGAQYICVPRPEVQRFVCPIPCGGKCKYDQPALYTPIKITRMSCSLRLVETRRLLSKAAQAPAAPLACDLAPSLERAACGPLYLN